MQVQDLLDDVPLSQGSVIPLTMKQLLREELNIADNWQHAEGLLRQAIAHMPEQLALKVALYKLYAYSNRFAESLVVINQTLQQAADNCGFNADWANLTAASTQWFPATGDKRLYLYSLKATGFVKLRSGDIDGAFQVLSKLLELDPQDQVGGSVVFEMAEQMLEV